MIRFLLFLAISFGIYWGFNHFDFNTFKSDTIQAFKKEKTISIINQTRTQTQEEINDIIGE